jgi:hypothetical protein
MHGRFRFSLSWGALLDLPGSDDQILAVKRDDYDLLGAPLLSLEDHCAGGLFPFYASGIGEAYPGHIHCYSWEKYFPHQGKADIKAFFPEWLQSSFRWLEFNPIIFKEFAHA